MARGRKLSRKASKKIFYSGANKTNVRNLSKNRMMRGGFNF